MALSRSLASILAFAALAHCGRRGGGPPSASKGKDERYPITRARRVAHYPTARRGRADVRVGLG